MPTANAVEAADPRYPLGPFTPLETITPDDRKEAIRALSEMPGMLREAIRPLNKEQINTPYREGGWTVRQLVHHVADSHGQMAGRVKLALTEDNPTIKPYDEKGWAELPDARTLPVEPSLAILDGLHLRLLVILRSLSEEQWARTYVHPERGPMTLAQTLALYDWHSRHHVAHVTQLRKRMGW